MNTYSVYKQATGIFIGKTFSGSLDSLKAQLQTVDLDCSYIIGEYDHLSQKVDLETGEVVDYIPPSPGVRYEWSADKKRWVYVPGAEEALFHAREDALKEINQICAFQLSAIRVDYPPDEVTSWAKQEAEARAWTADNSAPTPLLSAIADGRGVPLDMLAQKVIEKADLFAAYSGGVIGLRQRREDAVMACATAADVKAAMAELFPVVSAG